jgi:arginine deiminase
MTPRHLCLELAPTQLLFDHRANVNPRQQKHLGIAELLLKSGADVLAMSDDPKGQILYKFSLGFGRRETAEFLQ